MINQYPIQHSSSNYYKLDQPTTPEIHRLSE